MFKGIVVICSLAIIFRHYGYGQEPPINIGQIAHNPIYPIDVSHPFNNSLPTDNPINTDQMPIMNPMEDMTVPDMNNPLNNTGGCNLPIDNPMGFNSTNTTQLSGSGMPVGLLSNIGF